VAAAATAFGCHSASVSNYLIDTCKPAHVSALYKLAQGLNLLEEDKHEDLKNLLTAYDRSLGSEEGFKAFLEQKGHPAFDENWLSMQPAPTRLGLIFKSLRHMQSIDSGALAQPANRSLSLLTMAEKGQRPLDLRLIAELLKAMKLLQKDYSELEPQMQKRLELMIRHYDPAVNTATSAWWKQLQKGNGQRQILGVSENYILSLPPEQRMGAYMHSLLKQYNCKTPTFASVLGMSATTYVFTKKGKISEHRSQMIAARLKEMVPDFSEDFFHRILQQVKDSGKNQPESMVGDSQNFTKRLNAARAQKAVPNTESYIS
jgi:hypothetical protein